MSTDELIGSLGVALLLGAFAANLVGRLGRDSRIYQGLNALGAGIAGVASWRIGFIPFVVLEGVWMSVALVALVRPTERGAPGDER